MSIRSVVIVSAFVLAAILGRLQHIALPAWAWVVWALLLAAAITAWFVVARVVSLIIRKTVMIIPLSQKIEITSKKWEPIPVAGVEQATARIEDEIRAFLRVRPLQWLGVWAFRAHTEFFLKGIVEHCKAQGSEVIDARMFATWIHGAAAEKLGEFAGDLVSGGCQIAVIVLGALGIVFAVPS